MKDRLVIGFMNEEDAISLGEHFWNTDEKDFIILPIDEKEKKMQPFPKWLHEKSRNKMELNILKYLELKYPHLDDKELKEKIKVVMALITYM